VARTLLVAKIDVEVAYRGNEAPLSANEFAGATVSPRGFVHLESFAVQDGIPTWRYTIADALLEQQIFMPKGANTSYLRLEVLRCSAPLRIALKPFVTYRDYHSHAHGPQAFQLETAAGECRIQAFDGAQPYRLSISQGQFTQAPAWYWNFWHRAEAERGLDASEDLLLPGTFGTELAANVPVYLIATAESAAQAPGSEALKAIQAQSNRLVTALPKTAPPWIHSLARASDHFFVRRGDAGAGTASIIAGYPWFADWGRDTMISLPGLATLLGRFGLAAGILRTYASFVDRGMLPNRFPDAGEAPEYNTADAALWMFHAVDDYFRARPDPTLLRDLLPTLMSIIHAHADGTRFGIRVDPKDGLLFAGEAGTALTWMDAKNGNHAFTPRIGKAVEINALWLNALEVAARLAARARERAERNFCESLLTRAGENFGRFWNEERRCLFDVIDVEGTGARDDRVRPNQILAVSLPHCVLPQSQMRAVVECCAEQLLTSYGLRTLSPGDPAYIGRYEGNPQQRDGAYHMGTAWAWLLGPFTRAHFRVYGNARRAQALLEPMAQHVDSACIGSISEIFDGDAPHNARGCFAQAWSVAEILRAWVYLERRISMP
jgi:predicted glycogen debranching enzyme